MNYLQKYSRLVDRKQEVSKNYFLHKGCNLDLFFMELFGIGKDSPIKIQRPSTMRRDGNVLAAPKDLMVATIKVLNYIGIPFEFATKDRIKIKQGYLMVDKLSRDQFFLADKIEPYMCVDCSKIVDTKPFSYLHYRNNMCNSCGKEILFR